MFRTVFLKISSCLLLIFLAACHGHHQTVSLPYYNAPDFTPLFLDTEKDVASLVPHRISSFSFTDQSGKIVTQKDIEGKVRVANFFFTSCSGICPAIMDHMKILQQAFGNNKNVAILSFSVTPWIDSVGALKKYATEHQINAPNWHLLTGDKAEIYSLARRSYFAEEDLGFSKDSTDFLHTEHLVLVDRQRRIRGIYNGTLSLDVEKLQKDINELLKEDD
jgi:protein SCO1/2